MPSVAEIYLEQGRRLAEAKRRQGENSANLAMNIGNAFSGAAQQIGQHYADAPRREMQDLQLKEARRGQASADTEIKAEAALRQLFATTPTPEPKAIIRIVGPERGTKIVTGLLALQDTEMNRFKTQQEVVAATLAGMDALPEAMRAEIYPSVRQTLVGRKVIGEHDAPAEYDPKWFQQARNFGQAAPKPKEAFTLNPGDVRFGPDGKQIASVAPTPKPEEGAYVTVKGPNGRPVRQWIPKTKMETGVEEYEKPDAPRAPEPLESVIGPNGQPILVPRSQAIGKMPATSREKPTEDERKSAGFYASMRDAITVIDELENKITEKELYQIQSLPQEKIIGMLNRGEMSEAAKRYLRAFEQFTESRLRPVSGAAINDSEYERDRRTYAKQYGETPKLNEDRTRARNLALDSLGKRAGVLKPKDDGAAQSGPVSVKAPDGQTYHFPNQAAADAFKKQAGIK